MVFMRRGQGALEYLLLIGGAVIVSAVVIVLLLNTSTTSKGQAQTSADLAIEQSDAKGFVPCCITQ